ncbi:MAG: hypothetical protein AAF567_12570 [Actinomycetota bacterium]
MLVGLTLFTPATADAQTTIDGEVAITAMPSDPGYVQVDISVQNRGARSMVNVDQLALPVEAAATAQCRSEFQGNTRTVPVDASGVIQLVPTTIDMPAASELLTTCRFEIGTLCDLDATASATWIGASPAFTRMATAPITPSCAGDTRRALIVLFIEPSTTSVPIGSNVGWTVTAQNVGNRALTGVRFTVPLPDSLEFLASSADAGVSFDEATRTVRSSVNRIPIGESRSFQFGTRMGALSLTPVTATVSTRQGASSWHENRVFGIAAEPAPQPAADRDRDRDQDRPRRLAHTAAETPLLGVVGATVLAAGVMVRRTARTSRASGRTHQ